MARAVHPPSLCCDEGFGLRMYQTGLLIWDRGTLEVSDDSGEALAGVLPEMDQWLQAPGSIHFILLIVATLTVSHLIRSELCDSQGGATEDGSPIYYTSLCNKHMVCFMHLWGMFFIRPAVVSMTELSFAHDLDLKLKSLLGTLLTCSVSD